MRGRSRWSRRHLPQRLPPSAPFVGLSPPQTPKSLERSPSARHSAVTVQTAQTALASASSPRRVRRVRADRMTGAAGRRSRSRCHGTRRAHARSSRQPPVAIPAPGVRRADAGLDVRPVHGALGPPERQVPQHPHDEADERDGHMTAAQSGSIEDWSAMVSMGPPPPRPGSGARRHGIRPERRRG